MYDLSRHPFFETWTDPQTGAVSYILKERVAPIQQTFYFTNPGFSPDGEYLWFTACFPPCPRRFTAYVTLNPDKPVIKWFPQGEWSSIPMVARDSSGIYFMSRQHLCFMDPDGKVKIIGSIPDDYIRKRFLFRSATHLSLSADGEWFLLDGQAGNVFFVALMHARTGEFKLLNEFPYNHNHALFSPVDPKLFLYPTDWTYDPITGKRWEMIFRLWLMDTDQTVYRHLCPDLWEHHSSLSGHEWWSKDGMVCFVEYHKGVYEVDPATGERTHVWKRPVCHAYCNSDRTLVRFDQTPYCWGPDNPLQVLLFNRATGQEKCIVSAMPPPPDPAFNYSTYHTDPHPHFSPDDTMIGYMTTVRGMIDVAVTPVAQYK